MIGSLVGDIGELVEKHHPPLTPGKNQQKELDEREAYFAHAVHMAIRLTQRVAENYLSGAIISDEFYTQIVDVAQGKPPIRRVAEEFTKISGILRLMRTRFETVTDQRKSKLARAITEIKEFQQRLPTGSHDPADALEQVIKEGRSAYVRRRTEYHDQLDQLEQKVGFSGRSIDYLLDLFARWDAPSEILNLIERLEKEEGLSPSEQRTYLGRAHAVKTSLRSALPDIRETLFHNLEEKIENAERQLPQIIEFDGVVATKEQELLLVCNLVDQLAENLGSLAYFRFVDPHADELDRKARPKDIPRDDHAEAITRRAKTLKEQVKFFREHAASFIYIVEALQQPNLFANLEVFETLSREYVSSYGTPRWHNRSQNPTGVYQPLARLEDRLLKKIRHGLLAGVEHLQMVGLYELLESSEVTATWKGFVDDVERHASRKPSDRRASLYNQIYNMSEYDSLKDALQTPQQITESLKRLRDIGRRQPLLTHFDELAAWYTETLADLGDVVTKLPGDVKSNTSILEMLAQQRGAIAEKLSRHIMSIPPPKSVSDKSAYSLRTEAQLLEDLLHQSKDASPKAYDYLVGLLSIYYAEEKRRTSLPYRLGRRLHRLVWGSLPRLLYVPDTNVLLNDPNSLATFGEENGVVLLQTVLLELDKLKGDKNPDTQYRAREATRNISRWTGLQQLKGVEKDDEERVASLPEVESLSGWHSLLRELGQAFRSGKKRLEHESGREVRPGFVQYTHTPSGISPIYKYDKDDRLKRRAAKSGLLGVLSSAVYSTIQRNEFDSWRDLMHIVGAMKLQNVLTPLVRRWAKPEVVIVSMDDNASHAAVGSGIMVQPYRRGSVLKDPKELYTGYRILNLPPSMWSDIEQSGLKGHTLDDMLLLAGDSQHASVPFQDLPKKLTPNEFVIAEHPNNPLMGVVARYEGGVLVPLTFIPSEGKVFPLLYMAQHPEYRALAAFNPMDLLQVAATELLLNQDILCCSLVGGPGVGKTLLATGAGVRFIRDSRSPYRHLQYTKPNVSTGKEEGAVPGDEIEKQLPRSKGFLGHLADAWSHTTGKEINNPVHIMGHHPSYSIELVSLALIRGMDISSSFRIIDEGQNMSIHDMRTWLSRHAEDAKSVMLGDLKQTDVETFRYMNGLLKFRTALIGYDWFGHITFDKSHRSPVADAVDKV